MNKDKDNYRNQEWGKFTHTQLTLKWFKENILTDRLNYTQMNIVKQPNQLLLSTFPFSC